jgi:hypothetical protein
MALLEHRGEVRVRRYSSCRECDVVVTVHGREMVLQMPDYRRALNWAQMEAKSYNIAGDVSEERAG